MAKRGENIYKRKDGRYEGRYIKGHRLCGKPMFGYVYAYSYTEVKRNLTLAKATAGQVGVLRVIGKGSLGEYLSYWLESVAKERVRPSTLAQYHDRINRRILPALGKIPVAKLSKEHTQSLMDALTREGLAPSTVTSIMGVLRSAMKTAAELRLTMSDPCAGLTMPKKEVKERRALDRAEQIRLETQASLCEKSTKLSVFLALYAGLRIGEICALKWEDIDLYGNTLTVRGTVQRIKTVDGGGKKTELTEGAPKSKRSHRTIPLPHGLAGLLQRHGGETPSGCYVLTGTKKPLEPRRVRARFAKVAGAAGLSIPFHSLRHTFATRCLEHNFDVQSLSELLGHSSANTTMGIYAHSVLEHKRLLTGRIHILSDNNKPSNEPSAFIAAC